MNCTKVREKLSFYLDEMLDEGSLQAIEEHLAGCADCRRELAALKMFVHASREIEHAAPPAGLKTAILQAVRDAQMEPEHFADMSGMLVACVDQVEPPRDLRARITASIGVRERVGIASRLREVFRVRSLQYAVGAAAAAVIAICMLMGTVQSPNQTRRAAVEPSRPALRVAHVDAAVPITLAAPKAVTAPVVEKKRPGATSVRVAYHRKHRAIKPAPEKVARVVLPKYAEAKEKGEPADATETRTESSDTAAEGTEMAAVDTGKPESVKDTEKSKPGVEITAGGKIILRRPLTEVASAETDGKGNKEEWLQEMKTRAAMRGSMHRVEA